MLIWVILIVNCVVTVFNTLFLIAIASLLMKVIQSEDKHQNLENPPNGGLVDLPVQPNYADLIVMHPEAYNDLTIINYDGMAPRQPNHDGAGGIFNQ